jgi:hypothetical protein
MNMTANNAQPMSQKQADALRREWALLLKMGYASQWTPVQKMARQNEIVALLLQAGEALPQALTRQEMLASEPIRTAEGGRYYVDLADIPQPWREGFWVALHGSGRPIVEGVERAAYAWDWEGWVCGQAFSDPAVMRALHRLADYPVLAALAATRTHATSLDGRACRYLYEAAGSALAQYEVSESERAFMQQLSVVVPTNAREAEEVLLTVCLEVAQGVREMPCSAQQANVMRVAAMVIGRSFPASQKRLSAAAARYFEAHPGEAVESAEIVRRGWVSNLPRLRDRLEHKLRMARAQ